MSGICRTNRINKLATIRLIRVLSIKMINNSSKFTWILDASIIAPFSDIKINCVIDNTPIKNLVYGDAIVPEAMIAGINISAKPATIVVDAALASGI